LLNTLEETGKNTIELKRTKGEKKFGGDLRNGYP
jgi:hypothetical protein